MATDGPGKYKGNKRRTAKPYDRPQGIFRRVTDSVSGLFESLSGWLGTDDDGSEEAPAPTAAAPTSAPPGESFIFAQPPTTHRKPYRPIYPEEGEDAEVPSSSSNNSQVSSATPSGSGINLGASSSASTSGPTSMAPTPLTRGLLGTTSTSLGHPLPLISSTPYDQPLRTRPLMRPTPTSIDSGTETPATDFIMPPRRVGLDEETFSSLRMPIISEANKTSSPSANAIPSLEKMSSSPVNAMPSLEETQRKRAREIDIDHNSSLGGDSISNRSLFSETCSRASQPQLSASSKRPRFNVSAFSASPVMGERSLLSDSATRPSPFYPWRTAYGGASANKRSRYQNRLQPNRAQIKPKPPPSDASTEDGGLSQAARRILDCLNNISTPISDAKRIPTPSPGQRGSFLDSSYTATYYKHRPPSRNSGPPVTKLLTPTKAVVQPNLSKLIGGGSSGEGSSTVAETSSVISTPVTSTPVTSTENTSTSIIQKDVAPVSKPPEDPPPSTDPSQDSSLLPEQQEQTSNVQTTSTSASIVSKPADTEVISKSTTETTTFSFKSTTETSSVQPMFRFGEGNKTSESASTEKPLFRFGNGESTSSANEDKESSAIITSRPSIHASEPVAAAITKGGGGGKLKTKVSDTGRASRREEEEEETPIPVLPAVSLTMSSLPKINFTATQTNAVIASSELLTTTGFTFSAPQTFSEPQKAALKSLDGPIVSNELEFTFSTPQNLLNDASKVNHTSGAPMFNSISTSFQPKLKTSASKSKLNAAGPLKEGSILDILKSNKVNTSVNEEKTKSESTITTTNSLEQFMKKSNEWNCDTCMVTNKDILEKCASCETVKPGASKKVVKTSCNLTPVAIPVVTNSLSAFMKKGNEWNCDTCMLTNKSDVDKCAACETQKPGSAAKTSVTSNLPLSSSNSSFNAPVGFNFQKSSSEWECSECLVRNKDNAETCVCCQSAKPGSTKAQQSSSVFSSGLSSNNSLVNNSDWKCETCLVQNTKDTKKCKECDTAKPSAVIGSQVITGNFKFGVGSNTSANDSSSGGFKFGVSNSSETTETKSSGFSFGVNPSSVNKDSITTSTSATTGFSFGIKPPIEGENSATTTGFKFGVNSTENKVDKKPETPQKPTEENTNMSSKSEVSLSNADSLKTEDKADSVPKPAFSFGSASGGFTFGGNANGKNNDLGKHSKDDSSVSIENTKESEKTPFAFSFGSKPTENDVGASQKPAFPFSNSSSKDSSSIVNSSETFPFGTPKGDEKLKTSAPTFTFGAKPTTESPSLTFGGNTTQKSNTDAPTTNSTFTFGSVAATTKEETKSPFGGKRDSSSCDEPARKLPFGTSNTASSGVGNSTTSLFTFGSNTNSGPGFGAAPASNPPAFGSPAPVVSAANPTPSFSFNSTAPSTTPAFGSAAPTPMFGQGFAVPNNNNNNPSFAFGQPTEKKASTGFDFGQATPNSSTPAFNFASSEPTSGPGLFQFGQSQPNNTSTGGAPLFQFGSGAPAATPAFGGGGGDNIFSSAAPRSAGGQPDRRIKKKAVRRIPK